MSLNVDAVARDPVGESDVLDTPEGCDDSAGFGFWCQKVWGPDVVRSLGARRFPLLTAAVGVPRGGIEHRLDNIEAATLRARRLGARVLVR